MTHPLIVALTENSDEIAKEFRLQGADYPTNPRATAVFRAFMAKLQSDPQFEDVPLDELVTPASLPTWQATFENPEQRAEVLQGLRNFGLSVPRVLPQPDGSLGILMPWQHPDQDEVEIVDSPRQVFAHTAFLELVEEPDDWRVSRIA